MLFAACHPYLSGGVETSSRTRGPLANLQGQPVASARPVTALSEGETAPINTAPTLPHTYSVAIGSAPVPDFHIELGLHAHDISSDSWQRQSASAAYLSSPRYLTGTGSLDFSWMVLRFKHVGTYIHVGPAFGVIVDRGDGSRSFGQAVRFGAGIQIDLPLVRLYVDASQTELMITSGPAAGVNQLAGITMGLGLH
ncbi:hypothetical protein BH11MYX1_BH11MYX1_08190 [soil metagenome]